MNQTDELEIRNKLIIIYALPINTYNRTKKEVRDLWQEVEISNINRSKKLIKELSYAGYSTYKDISK